MKKKLILCLACAGLVLLVLCGIIFVIRGKSYNEISNTKYYDRDKEKISEHLKSYSNEIVSLKETNAFIASGSYVRGRKYWDAFLKKCKKGEKCSIDIITFSMVNTAIVMYLEYNGSDYYLFTDKSRAFDEEGTSYNWKSGVATHDYLNCLNMEEGNQQIVLSNIKFDSYEDYFKIVRSPSYDYDDETYILTFKPSEE